MMSKNNSAASIPPPLAAAAAAAAGLISNNSNKQQRQPMTTTSSAPPIISAEICTTTKAAAAAAAAVNTTTTTINKQKVPPPPAGSLLLTSSNNNIINQSSTAYYDNLKTRLLSSTSTRHDALKILTDFMNTHPLVRAVYSLDGQCGVQQQNDEGREKATAVVAATTTTISTAEYTSFLNATLPIFQSLLISPASDTSIALLEIGGRKGTAGGGGSGAGAAGSKKKKKKKAAAEKVDNTKKKDSSGKNKKQKKGGGIVVESKEKKVVGISGGSNSSTATGKKGDKGVVAVAPPPLPLDGTTTSTAATATISTNNATNTTTAATTTGNNTKKKGNGNSGNNNSTSKKTGGNNAKKATSSSSSSPPVPSYYVPPNSSSSSIDHQIRHLIVSLLTKLPLTLSRRSSSRSSRSNVVTGGATAKSTTAASTTIVIRPNHVHSILTMALHTLLEDYEPNALLAVQLLHKWHLHLGNISTSTATATTTSTSSGNTKENAKLMKECQLFFEFVIGTFKDMGKKGVNGGEAWLNQLFGTTGSTTAGGAGATTTTIALKSKQSIQVLAEIPSIIQVIFQFHSKLYKSNAVAVVPALMEGLKLTAPAFKVGSGGGGGSGGGVIGATTGSSSSSLVRTKTTTTTTTSKSSVPTPIKTTTTAAATVTTTTMPSSPTSRAPVPDPTKSVSMDDSQSVTSSSTSHSLLSISSSSNNRSQPQQQQLSPHDLQKQLYHQRLVQFLNMQVKILAYLTCLLRKAFVTKPPIDADRSLGGYKSNETEHHHHHLSTNYNNNIKDPLPWASATTVSTLLRPHEEMMATIIIQLLRNCPREDATIRKELLLSTRLILSITEFRAGFFRHIDNMLDERILVGCATALVRGGSGATAAANGGMMMTAGSTMELQRIIRPLGYTVLAEFLSFVRTKLTPAQLSRVIRIFSRLLHDTQTDVPISLQIMSVRLLLNLCEVVYLSKDPNVQVGRDLLVRILMTVVQKFRTLKDKIPKIMEDAEREIEVRVRWAERVKKVMIGEEGVSGGGGDDHALFDVEYSSWVVEDATFDGDYHGDPLFILRDIQSLLHPMILRMRNLFYYISTYSHHIDKEMRKANVAGEDRYPLPLFVTNRENDEVSSATLKLTQGEREIVSEFLMSGICCLKVFRMDVDPNEDPSLMKLYDKSNPSPKFREVCDTFAVIFTGLESHNFARIVAPSLSKILEEVEEDSALIGIFSSILLDSRGVGKSHSYDLCAVLVPYILENFNMLGEYEEVPCERGDAACDGDDAKGVAPPPPHLRLTSRANNLFKIFNLALSSLMKHAKNEAAFLPHLQKITAECLKGSTRGPFLVPNPYSNILRSMFRTISAGKFEDSYKELHPLVTTILNELYRIYTMTNHVPFRLILIELCLTLPTRLSVLLPHLPLLMKLVVPALKSNEGDLVNLGLRTLEFWVDNLHPDFLFPIFAQQSSTLCELMLALTLHLQPAPYPYGLLCLRLIGKLGGKNRLFLQEVMTQNRDENESITAHQLSLQCEWLCQSSPESNEVPNEMDSKVSTSSFLLPLPLERAVEVLRLTATSPKIVVKKGGELNIQSTPTVNRHCSEVLFQDSRCLDINSLTIEFVEKAKKEQSKAAFTVIKGALASVLDVNNVGVLPVDCNRTYSNEEEKIESLLEASDCAESGDASTDVDVNTEAFRKICDGLFAAAAVDGLREEAIGLLKGVAAHVFLVVSSNENSIVRIDGDGSTTDPFQNPDEYESSDHIDGKIKPLKPFGCFRLSGPLDGDINPFVFNQSLVDAFSDGSTLAATEVIHFVIEMFGKINSKIAEKKNGGKDADAGEEEEVVGGNTDVGVVEGKGVKKEGMESNSMDTSPVVDLNGSSCGQILFEQLLSEFCLACFRNEWIDRTGVMNGIILLMRKLGLGWCKHFEVALLHTAIFAVKDAPSHVANACEDAMFFFVRVTSFLYGSPVLWEGSPDIHDILSPDGCSQILSSAAKPVSVSKASLTLVVAEIASTNALVRFAVRHFLRIVSNDCKSLDKLLSGHVTSLKRLLFAKLLRTLSLPDLVAVVDAVAFINEAVPNLIPISDANMMSFLGELIKMICIADGEISDENFSSVVLIDKNGWAVDCDGKPISDNKLLVHPSSIFHRHTITLRDDNIGAHIVVPEGLNLGVQLRVSTLFLFRAIVRLDEFFEAGIQTQMGNLRPHIVALLFRSLISELPPAVLTSTSALKQALKLAEGVEDADDAPPRHRLSKELIQACIRPILINLRDHKQLSIPLLNGLSSLLTLLSSWFNKSLGDKMLDHLQRFLEPEKIIALKLWRAGEEPLVAAAVIDLFSVLPQASNFVEALVKTTIRLESVLSAYGANYVCSPFRGPLSRYLNRHCAGTVGFFLEEHRLSNPMYNDLLFDILNRDDSRSFRQYLGGKECTVMLLNVCFERPLGIIRSEKQSPTTKAGSAHLNAYGINQWYSPTAQRKLEIARQAIEMKKKILSAKQQEEAKSKKSLQSKGGDKKSSDYQAALKVHQGVRDAYERAKKEVEDAKNSYARQISTAFQRDSKQRTMTTSALELQTQGFRIVGVLTKLDPQYLSQHNDVVRAMRWLWRSRARHYRLLHEEEMPPRYHNESLLLSRFLVSYSQACPEDTDVLFDLIRIFLQPFASIDFSFIKMFLVETMVNVLTTDQKSQVMQRFLTLLSGDGSEETKILSCQMLIMPTLKQGNPKEVFGDASVRLFVKLLLKDGGVFGSKLTCELLNMVMILLDQMREEVGEYRKDVLKYIWGILMADHSNTKYIGYLALSKFVAVFETPPKVILQVYKSLLRSHSSVERQNVLEAMKLLLPNLRVRLKDPDLELALKCTVKVMQEVEDSLPHVAHLWDAIIRHIEVFECFKVTIMPYLKHAVQLLGSHLHSHPEYRELSVSLTELMIGWTDGGDAKSLSQKVADAHVNILVRIALLNVESKPNHVNHRVRARALTQLQAIIARRKMCNIDPTHFQGTTLVLLSTKPKEKTEMHDSKDASSKDDDAEDERRKQFTLRVCVQICSILQSHDPTNEFLDSNFCEILSRCFSFLTSTNDLELSTMLENLVTRILTDGTASAELISNVAVAVDNAIIESRNRIEDTKCGFLVVSIVEKVSNIGEVFVQPFMSSLYMLAEQGVKKHLKEIEESTNTTSLTKQGKFHKLASTPTSGILRTAFGSHFKEVVSSKDMQMNDGDPRNQITTGAENLSAEMKALVTCIMLIGSSERAFKNNVGRGFADMLLDLLNSSNSLPVLVMVVSIMGKWLLAGGQAPLTTSECSALLLGLTRFDFERLSEVDARYLSDQICCFVLMAYGYDRSIIENHPFGVHRHQSVSTIHDSLPNDGLIRQEAFQKLFMACLLSANQQIRTLSIAIFGMRPSDCILVHGELSKMAIERGCRANDSIDVVGIPCREPGDILRQLLESDFECIGGRLWTTVMLDVLLATSNHQGGVGARASGAVEDDPEKTFASFMPLKSYDDACAQGGVIGLRCDDFDDGVYSSFVKAISAERSVNFCGKGRCIAAVRQLIHGDSRTFQALFEHCLQAAWQNLPSDTARTSLIQPLEALLAKPYHSQFTNTYNAPKVNAIQSMLQLLVKLRPIPVLDTFLLQSLSSDYNAIYEVLTYFECEYDALRKIQVVADSSPYHLIKAIQRCYDALGERDVCTSISSAISSSQTKLALSLDMYGFVNESADAYSVLIDRAGDDTSLLPSEDELQIWEQRWVDSHKEMSQWSLIDEFASSHGEARLSLEAAWKTKNWEKVKSLFATPSVVALLEEGDQCAKMMEMYLAIQEGSLDEVDSIHAQIAQLCLYRWQLLPSISSGSQAHQSLLQQCTRLVELRESSQLLVETNAHASKQTVPDLKTLLTAWKHRSPNIFEPISEWEDLFLWRSNIFDAITSNFGWVEAGTLATLHDRPHCCIALSRAARKQDLKEVSTYTMNSLGDSIMDVDTAFLKLREEVTTYQHSSENMLKGGLNLVNSANVSYFSDRQKAEVFRLKAYFLNELRDKPKANQAYCQAVQICPNHARAWQDWGDLCVSLSDSTRKKLADDKADKKDLAKKASQYLSQATGCYLEALRVDTSEKSRDRIPHCLSMLAADGRQYGNVCRTLQARGASTPAWCWLPWIPQLLSSLCRVEARAVKPILIGILKDHPQALYYSLRSFFLERRDVEKSMPDQKSDGANKDESGDHQSSLKLAEIIMSSLRKTHPVLWNRLEVILDNLIVRFRPSYEAELLQTIIALINRTMRAEEKMNGNSDGNNNDEKRTEYYEKTLSRIGDKFFSKSASLSKKALHFQSRYGSLFESDFGPSNLRSFEELVEKLQKWKSLLERQVSRIPTKCKLSESSPALSWYSSQTPDMWAGACSSKSFSASNTRQDALSSPQFYDSTRSSALKAARASSYAVRLAAQSEGIDGYAGGGAAAVEIPGQYSPTSAGVFDSRPIPEIHAKLVRFKQILEVTSTGSTKQHVHRITMIGSDGKEYKFLLQLAAPYSTRTDERSAQMQFIMGRTLRGDIRACRRGLIVRPNVVIPLAQRMRMSATQDSHQSLESILNCMQRSSIDLPTHFQDMVDERVSRLEVTDSESRLAAEKNAKLEVYTEICQQHMPSNILTKYMMQVLPSTESLFQFRKQFTSHLAVNSVLQYAVAAVERTPTRFVLCNKTGQVLAHDLRSSYNHGLLENQALPFRLTRNITEFIGPFLLDGVFVPSFVSICGAMSSRRNILEPMLHLLSRDDVISWYTSKTSAANDKKIQDIELQLSDRVWKNVRFVQQRLDSCAPERVENVAEAIKGNVAPIDMKVRTLVDAACCVDRLSSMPASYQAWL